MAGTIEFDETAVDRLRKLAPPEARRIRDFLRDRIAALADPGTLGKALRGARFRNLWRYRVGDCRVLFELRDESLVVLVVEIGPRREVYR